MPNFPRIFLALSLCTVVAGAARLRAEAVSLPAGLVTTASGLKYVITEHGTGAQPKPGQVVLYHYRGTLEDGTVFDNSFERPEPFAFTFGRKQVIKGVEEAFNYFRVGDKGTMIIPPELAYGEKQRGPIPPNSTLRFDVVVVDVKESGLADVLRDAIESGGVEAARQRLEELKAAKFAGCYLSEAQLNGAGYRFLGQSRWPEALFLFGVNVELYPKSGNVYDSLAEALLKSGDRAGAIQNYEKSLALDPKNENARKVLAEIRSAALQP